ncbi:hypothetical protein Bca4012_044074 [Brassica carinata]
MLWKRHTQCRRRHRLLSRMRLRSGRIIGGLPVPGAVPDSCSDSCWDRCLVDRRGPILTRSPDRRNSLAWVVPVAPLAPVGPDGTVSVPESDPVGSTSLTLEGVVLMAWMGSIVALRKLISVS